MRAIIVDDEKPARERLSRLLKMHQDVEIVGEASDGNAALAVVLRMKPDVVFIDIEMPVLNGLEAAAAIGQNGPPLVFVTAYDEYALKAFELHAVDYLVKPVSQERLDKCINRLRLTRLQASQPVQYNWMNQTGINRRTRFAVKSGHRYLVFNFNDVSAIVANNHYIEVVHGEERALADESLDTLSERLDPSRFIRIHRGAIISLDYLKEMMRDGDRKYTAVLSDYAQSELPISRENIDKLRSLLSL